jgi:hypothetical protein
MAKPTKVKYDKSDDECKSDDYRSDEEEDYSKEELIDMCESPSLVLVINDTKLLMLLYQV